MLMMMVPRQYYVASRPIEEHFFGVPKCGFMKREGREIDKLDRE